LTIKKKENKNKAACEYYVKWFFFIKGYVGGKSNHNLYIYYNMIEKERKRKEGGNVRVIDNLFFLVRKIKLNKLECMCIGRVFK
jgi:hypothetical protein